MNSLNNQPIDYSVHCEWFENTFNSNNIYIYILTDGQHDIGQLRLNETEYGMMLISFSIASEYRGHGYGTEIIKRGVEKIINERGAGIILSAEVRLNNVPSQRCFERNGFICTSSDNDIMTFTKSL
jgi:spore coat polysaccharide biosynthesis protein SpsF